MKKEIKIEFYEDTIRNYMGDSHLPGRNETEKIVLANNILLQRILSNLTKERVRKGKV